MEERRNYYCIITQDVMFDKKLKANEKLLYGVITSLTNEKGYCWASNSYLANLFNVDKKTISSWCSNLHKQGYIKIELLRNEEGIIIQRRITLSHK